MFFGKRNTRFVDYDNILRYCGILLVCGYSVGPKWPRRRRRRVGSAGIDGEGVRGDLEFRGEGDRMQGAVGRRCRSPQAETVASLAVTGHTGVAAGQVVTAALVDL